LEGVLNDLSSRGALAAPLAAIYAIATLGWWTGALVVAIRQLREQSSVAVELGQQARIEYERQSNG
jgi:hypothetical protein